MSNYSHNLIEDISHLYRNISSQDYSYLDETSEYYDEELKNLIEDIIATISLEMIYEGYSAKGVLDFLSHSVDEEIIEKYLGFDENIISESVISEEYIEEQLILINEGIGSALGLLGRAMFGAGARRTLSVATKRAMGPGARKAMKGAVTKVKDIAVKTKEALPKIAKGAAAGAGALGLGAAGGYIGAKAAGAGSDKSSAEPSKPTPSGPPSLKAKQDYAKSKGKYYSSSDQKTYANYNDALAARNSRRGVTTPAAPAPAAPSGGSGGGGGGGRRSSSPAPASVKPPKPTPANSSDSKLTPMQQWAKANPKLADKVKLGQSGYDEISAMRDKPGPNEKQDQTPTTGPDLTPDKQKESQKSVNADLAKANTPAELNKPAPVGSALAAEQEKMKQKQREEKKRNDATTTPTTASESYEPYDVVLEYLLSEGHVDSVEEAHYVMMEMDAETIGSIVEERRDPRGRVSSGPMNV